MRAVQGAVSTPTGAYKTYVSEGHGTATLKCDVYTAYNHPFTPVRTGNIKY